MRSSFKLILFMLLMTVVRVEKNSQDSYDCSLIKEYLVSERSNELLDAYFKPSSLTHVKCGILPSALVNNQISNAKFLLKWSFHTVKSIEVEFQLDSIENYSSLNYYFALRRFNDEEFNMGVNELRPGGLHRMIPAASNDTQQVTTSVNMTSGWSTRNSMMLNVGAIMKNGHHSDEFGHLKNAFVVCVVILNIRMGAAFSLPFMCMDVFIDKFYYEKDKVNI